jgi:hypothetical protein
MNTILNPTQSDTKQGAVIYPAAVDLTGKEGYLAKIVSNGATPALPNLALPTATDDFAVLIIGSGDVATHDTAAEAPSVNETCRIMLKGACSPGDELSLADPSVPADAGKLRKRPATAGTWRTLFIAEESGVDGQFVLCRRVGERTTTI